MKALLAALLAFAGFGAMPAGAAPFPERPITLVVPLAAGSIITPHPGEAARLLGISTEAVQADRSWAALKLARKYAAVCVLKGAGTLVAVDPATPCGRCEWCQHGQVTVLVQVTDFLCPHKAEREGRKEGRRKKREREQALVSLLISVLIP